MNKRIHECVCVCVRESVCERKNKKQKERTDYIIGRDGKHLGNGALLSGM